MDQKTSPANNGSQGGGPVMDVQAPKPAAPPAASTPAPAVPAAKPLKAPKTGKTPIGVILVAIVVGLSLCGLTVFAYLKTKDAPSVNENQKTQTQQRANSGDVDDTTKGIDESMKSLNDGQDFNESDLSDTNLGL